MGSSRSTEITWEGGKPDDAAEWESIIRARLEDVIGVCNVTLRREGQAWRLVAATCGGIGIGMGTFAPPIPPDLDVRSQLLRELTKSGKAVIA